MVKAIEKLGKEPLLLTIIYSLGTVWSKYSLGRINLEYRLEMKIQFNLDYIDFISLCTKCLILKCNKSFSIKRPMYKYFNRTQKNVRNMKSKSTKLFSQI